MRFLLCTLSLCVVAATQSTLTTTFASNNGQAGNMFDLVATNPTGVTIEFFDISLDPGTFDVEVYVLSTPGTWVGNEANAAAWTLVGAAPGVVSAGSNQPTLLPIPVCQFIPSGGRQAFYITTSTGAGLNYTNGSTTGALYTSNADLEYYEGCGKAYPFSTTYQPRIWNGNIYYSVGQGGCNPMFASSTPYGNSCGGNPVGDAQYEQFTTSSSFDLSGTGQTYIWSGTGYVVTDGAASIVPPTGSPTAFNDDQIQPVALGFTIPSPNGDVTEIGVSSNGWLTFDASVTDNDLSESVSELLNDSWSRLAFLWDDLNPAAGGDIYLEQVSGSEFRITFMDVPEYTSTGANTVQVSLLDIGLIEVRYGNCSLSDCLVGVSPGYGANDLGGFDYTDLVNLGAVVVETRIAPFFPEIELLSDNRPVVGTSWMLTTNNVDPVSPFAITLIGLPSPVAIPLDSIGAPGCEGLLSVIGGDRVGMVSGGSTTVSVPLPNDPTLLGFVAAAQSVSLTLSNLANFITSNGIEATLGS